MTVIHLVTSVDKINFGIWNAAIFGWEYLAAQYKVTSLLWVTGHKTEQSLQPPITTVFLPEQAKNPQGFIEYLKSEFTNNEDIIIVTHGCWRLPTKLGFEAKKNGYRWIYVPHGMLEPWSMKHRKWKKLFYFHLLEKRMGNKADIVRAVGSSEKTNLEPLLKRQICLVENGVSVPEIILPKKNDKVIFLFMARLHFKKGITPLVKAWNAVMKNNSNAELIIAGPDEGELKLIQPYLSENVTYAGVVYGKEKIGLLQQANYYVLPSLSEGFPVSVLEAMSYGCIPIISEGCNFATVFNEKLGYKIDTEIGSISNGLQQAMHNDNYDLLSKKNAAFIAMNYSEAKIGEDLWSMYKNLSRG